MPLSDSSVSQVRAGQRILKSDMFLAGLRLQFTKLIDVGHRLA